MSPVINSLITILLGIFTAGINTFIAMKMKNHDADTRKYKQQCEAKEAQEKEEKDKIAANNNEATLGLMRIALLENYQKVQKKGFYTKDEREVYHPLYEIYKVMGGDGVIDRIKDEIINLPMHDPKEKN